MGDEEPIELIQQLMGASHVFCSTVKELLERSLAEATEEQLVLSQVKLLLLIGRPGRRLKVTDVADFLGVTDAAASRSIDRLVQRGLVDRSASTQDRRAVELALTPESEALLERFAEVRTRELLRLLGTFPADEMRVVTKLLDELSVRVAELEEGERERPLRCGVDFREAGAMGAVLNRECVVSRELYGPGSSENQGGDELVAEAF